ncbi:MAG: NADH:ubiquinone reductase (Na(+)-transporting) subunit F [Flavobacteriales bacterium]|nr:NADH:ubiquinone reductase (Na(+)-transporting) subunit F [Flavobacteriales bacterium]
MEKWHLILITGLVFTSVVLILVSVLVVVRGKLFRSSEVIITINEDKKLKVKTGESLLSTLSQNKIYLPSACGGQGTCGMCKCQIFSGVNGYLPTEEPFFTRGQLLNHWHLACQVKVRKDMSISVPDEIFGIKKWECTVISNYNVATFIKAFIVRLPEGETLKFKAGGYIQVDVPKCSVDYKDIDISPSPDDPAGKDKYRADWDSLGLWSLKMENKEPLFRAYSMANHPAEGNIIMLTVRIATPPYDFATQKFKDVPPGKCSSYIFSRKVGDKVTISGPYGEFFINEKTDAQMVYIGGGAGMAPLRSHILHLLETQHSQRPIYFYYGARNKNELFFQDDFKALEKKYPNFHFFPVLSSPLPTDVWSEKKDETDSSGDGFLGYVHQAVEKNHLKKHPFPEDIEYYFCGPPAMNASVVDMCKRYGVPNENMHYDDFGG